MFHIYFTLMALLDDRLERDERGDVIGWLGIAAMTVAVIIFAVPGVKDVVTTVLASIKNQIGGL